MTPLNVDLQNMDNERSPLNNPKIAELTNFEARATTPQLGTNDPSRNNTVKS